MGFCFEFNFININLLQTLLLLDFSRNMYVLLNQRIQFKLKHETQKETTKCSTAVGHFAPTQTKFQREVIIRITMKTGINIKSEQTYKTAR